MRSHTKFGHDRFSRSEVYWKQTDRKAKSLKGEWCKLSVSIKSKDKYIYKQTFR